MQTTPNEMRNFETCPAFATNNDNLCLMCIVILIYAVKLHYKHKVEANNA